jgi:hypothetical protein
VSQPASSNRPRISREQIRVSNQQDRKTIMIRGASVVAAIGGIIVLMLLLGSWYTVDQTERGR